MLENSTTHLRQLSSAMVPFDPASVMKPAGFINQITPSNLDPMLLGLNVTAETFNERLPQGPGIKIHELFSHTGVNLDGEMFFPIDNDNTGELAIFRENEQGDVEFERVYVHADQSALVDKTGHYFDVMSYCESLSGNASDAWVNWPNTAVGWCRNIVNNETVGSHPRILRQSPEGTEPTQQDLDRGLVLHQRGAITDGSAPSWLPRPTRVYMALAQLNQVFRLKDGEKSFFKQDGQNIPVERLCNEVKDRTISLVKDVIANTTYLEVKQSGASEFFPKNDARAIQEAFTALEKLFSQSAVTWCKTLEASKVQEAENKKSETGEAESKDGGLSTGAIVGIVVGSVVGFCCLCACLTSTGGY